MWQAATAIQQSNPSAVLYHANHFPQYRNKYFEITPVETLMWQAANTTVQPNRSIRDCSRPTIEKRILKKQIR